jgi:hypothetical protein
MNKHLRAVALALALAATPACAGIDIPNPFAVAQSADQRAYALLQTYAALVEEAANIVRAPSTPAAIRRAIGQAEAVATPAAEALAQALSAYNAARNAGDADVARVQLEIARAEAEAPIAAFAAAMQTAQR